MSTPRGSYILVVDGGNTCLFRNSGSEHAIELEAVEQARIHNPRTSLLSEPRPGRSFQSMGNERSAYSDANTHQRRKDAFCEAALDRAIAAAGATGELILIQ